MKRKQRILEGRDFNREKVRIRDKHRCRKCNKKWKKGQRRFDVHHKGGMCGKKSRGYDKVDDIKGLITVCHKCHYTYHSKNQKNSSPSAAPSKYTSELLHSIQGMRRDGLLWREIGLKFGVKSTSFGNHIRRQLKNIEVIKRRENRNKKVDDKIILLFSNGKSLDEIGRRVGMKMSAVHQRLKAATK